MNGKVSIVNDHTQDKFKQTLPWGRKTLYYQKTKKKRKNHDVHTNNIWLRVLFEEC